MNVIGTLGGLTLQQFTIPFIESPLENALDVVTLDGTIYTDFVNQRRQWTISWQKLDEGDFDSLRNIYDLQFATGDYPTFIVPYYSINTPVRMYLNDKDIQKDGCWIMNVQIRLIQQAGFINAIS